MEKLVDREIWTIIEISPLSDFILECLFLFQLGKIYRCVGLPLQSVA